MATLVLLLVQKCQLALILLLRFLQLFQYPVCSFDIVTNWSGALFGLLLCRCQALQKAAEELIGRSVFVGWPHLYEALVESVSTDETQ